MPSHNWLRGDRTSKDKEWQLYPELKLSTSLPSVCGVIKISLHGEIAREMPGVAGEYRPTAGGPVLKKGVRALWRGWYEWIVHTDGPDRLDVLLSGCVNWCPASYTPAVDRDEKRKWRYEDTGIEWIGSYIRLTCDTHSEELGPRRIEIRVPKLLLY